MRLRPLRRRLRSSPRLAVRAHTPWPLRWLAIAIMLGICAAVALWAFEQGKNITGLDHSAKAQLKTLQAEVADLRAERERNQTLINTADSKMIAERAAQAKLLEQVKLLEKENLELKDELGFFQNLIPSSVDSGVAIRSMQARVESGELVWQVLLLRPMKNAGDFQGTLEFALTGTHADGSLWTNNPPGQLVKFTQYQRAEGRVALPAGVTPQTLSVKLMEKGVMRATQSVKI